DDGARLGHLRSLGFEDLLDGKDVALDNALPSYGPFDAIIEATGVPALVGATLPFLKKRGIFVIVGIHPQPAEIDLTQLVRMHQQIRGSYRADPVEWDKMVTFLDTHQ